MTSVGPGEPIPTQTRKDGVGVPRYQASCSCGWKGALIAAPRKKDEREAKDSARIDALRHEAAAKDLDDVTDRRVSKR